MMMLWQILLAVFLAGAVGGILNAMFSDNGFVLPRKESTSDGQIVRWGFLTNTLVGGLAAVLSWGMYGPFAALPILGKTAEDPEPVYLTLSAMAGAVLVGVGGARWITSQVDKSLLRAAASAAAGGGANKTAAARILTATPAQALKIAMEPQDH